MDPRLRLVQAIYEKAREDCVMQAFLDGEKHCIKDSNFMIMIVGNGLNYWEKGKYEKKRIFIRCDVVQSKSYPVIIVERSQSKIYLSNVFYGSRLTLRQTISDGSILFMGYDDGGHLVDVIVHIRQKPIIQYSLINSFAISSEESVQTGLPISLMNNMELFGVKIKPSINFSEKVLKLFRSAKLAEFAKACRLM